MTDIVAVKRYHPCLDYSGFYGGPSPMAIMEEDDTGSYVRRDDHDAVIARLEASLKAVIGINEQNCGLMSEQVQRIAALEAERDELRRRADTRTQALNEAEAENKRLREALQAVVDAGDTDDHPAKKMYWAARIALRQPMPQRGPEHD